ncbi:MAG: hypothetical protein KDA24_27790 [Deltaproteobacteria bacterium]|nr:hypothetical protein [Deltaproteobacteria bacterium]
MPCCGGDKSGKPISRLQYVAGRVAFRQLRTGISFGLHGAGLRSPRLARIATFWDQLSADWAKSIAAEEGILIGPQPEEVCTLEAAPPSHVAIGTGADDFGADWDDAWVDDAAPDAA